MSTITSRCPHCQAMNRLPISRIGASPVCGKCKQLLLTGKPIEGTPANLQALINAEQAVVIDFWAPWCSPCLSFAPTFSEFAKQMQQSAIFVKVDTEAQQQLGALYQIRSIPTFMLFKAGKKVDSVNGALPKNQFKQWLQQALNR